VQGIDLGAQLPNDALDALYDGLIRYQVLFFREQKLNPPQHLALAESFGEVDPGHPVYPHVDGYQSIVELCNEDDKAPDTDDWHKDLTFRAEPAFASILRGVEVPQVGGDTLWASMSAVYDSLSSGWKSDLEGLYAIHDMGTFRNDYLRKGGVTAIDEALTEVGSGVHPVIATHPVTGLKYLNVNQSFTRNIVDLTQGASDEVLQYLYQHVRRPEFQVRFRWENDSVAIWDNRITQHYAVCDYLPNRRHMQRVTINSDRRVAQ
jgi:taurine dioxygenase